MKDKEIIKIKRQNSLLKLENEKLQANLDYVAIMADVDIPEEEDDAQQEL